MKVLHKTVNPHFKRDINKLMVRCNIFAEKMMNLPGEKFAKKHSMMIKFYSQRLNLTL